MRDLIDTCAEALRATSPAFTRRNLLHAVRRAAGHDVREAVFDAALRARPKRHVVPGLLPERCVWTPPRLLREWDAYFPAAIVLVDRRPILDLFIASGVLWQRRLVAVALDGTLAPVVSWLKWGIRAGQRAPIVYLHDAATVVYPFAFEPLATLAKVLRGPMPFRDLGLPPQGRPAAALADPSLPCREMIAELEALPPALLVRYGASEAPRGLPGDPKMLPLKPPDVEFRSQSRMKPERSRS